MNNFDEIVQAILALPEAGEGMTIGAIAEAVGSDPSTVVSALEEIVDREEHASA